MSKVETTSKVWRELTRRINLGRQGARTKLFILDIVHKPLHNLERVKARLHVSNKLKNFLLTIFVSDLFWAFLFYLEGEIGEFFSVT